MTPQELKNSILKKAFTGKMSVQHRSEYVDESKIDHKKNKNIKDFEFDLPGNWTLSTIEGISKTVSTKKYQIKQTEVLSDGDFPVISQSNEFITGYNNDLNKVYKNKESVVIFGDHTTVVKYIDFDFVVGADGVKIFEPFSIINAKYLYYCLSFITIGLDKLGRYSRHYKFIKDEAIPVPPLGEQKRIVEKIEDLMILVDEYEKNWQKLEDLNKKFPEDMKKSLLQEAIRGKLVEQRLEEGSGEELYKLIQKEKEKLIKEGKLKKQKPLPEITEDEIPFDIPESWKWVRLGEITELNPKNQLNDDLDVGFVPMALVEDGYKSKHTHELKKWKTIKKGYTHFADGDIGIAKITPCFQNRKSVILSNLPNGYGAGTTELSIVRAYSKHLYPEYLLSLFKSHFFINGGIKSFSGTAGQQRIDKNYLKLFLTPLPPLAEQKRIVEKLGELLPLCDQLIKSDN